MLNTYIMKYVIKSDKDKVAIIAAFKLKDGRISYKGCEVYKKDFMEQFDSARKGINILCSKVAMWSLDAVIEPVTFEEITA